MTQALLLTLPPNDKGLLSEITQSPFLAKPKEPFLKVRTWPCFGGAGFSLSHTLPLLPTPGLVLCLVLSSVLSGSPSAVLGLPGPSQQGGLPHRNVGATSSWGGRCITGLWEIVSAPPPTFSSVFRFCVHTASSDSLSLLLTPGAAALDGRDQPLSRIWLPLICLVSLRVSAGFRFLLASFGFAKISPQGDQPHQQKENSGVSSETDSKAEC